MSAMPRLPVVLAKNTASTSESPCAVSMLSTSACVRQKRVSNIALVEPSDWMVDSATAIELWRNPVVCVTTSTRFGVAGVDPGGVVAGGVVVDGAVAWLPHERLAAHSAEARI